MKVLKLIFTIIAIILITYQDSYAQISKGGIPESFTNKEINNIFSVVEMPAFNIDSLLNIEAKEIEEARPFRFGYAIDVDMGLKNNGTWQTLSNGDKVWRLKIYSEGAFSINLIFDEFWLPEGARFFLYNEDHSMILGAFTSDVSNNEYYTFSTDLVQGNTVVLEYYEPAYTSEGIINIDKVIHGYKDMFKSDGLGLSGSCNIDVNCSQGNDWCVEKRAVSMILVDDNTALCSGCLINNERQDLTPYYLTANHCIIGNNPNTWIFRFKYWRPTCGGPDPVYWVSVSGSTIRANHAASDFALLELFSQPPSGFGVLYAGWERSSVAPPSAVGIHHPSGDVMKISVENNYPISSDYDPDPISPNSHWKVIWDNGTTEGGSSGSPLFNNNRRIIGQLHGGWASCSNPSGADYYGRFDVSWTGGGTSSTRLSNWLDPDNTGLTTVNPTSSTIYLINRTLTGNHKFAALKHLYIEGDVFTSGPLCQPSNVPFTAEPGSDVTIKAKTIGIQQGTHFKLGSKVTISASNSIDCSDEIVSGDFVDAFCNAQISKSNNINFQHDSLKQNNVNNKDEIINFSEKIILFPNPSSDKFEVKISNNSLKCTEIIIYNVIGKTIKRIPFNNNSITIDISSLEKGMYFVNILTEKGCFTKKFIKQ